MGNKHIKLIVQLDRTRTIHRTRADGTISSIERSGYHIGIDGIKGFFTTILWDDFVLSLSKDGIFYLVNKTFNNDSHLPDFINHIILVYMIAFIDALMYIILAPFLLALHISIVLGSSFAFMIILILSCYLKETTTFYYFELLYNYLCGSFYSLVCILLLMVMVPFYTVAPVLIWLGRFNELGTKLEYCYDDALINTAPAAARSM